MKKHGARVIEIDGLKDKSLDISAIGKIKKIIVKEKPDIVHTHASLSARIAAKLYGKCKIIYTKHCDFPISSVYKYSLVRRINRIINETLTHKIIATSELAKQNLMKQGLSENLIETVLNGVDGFKQISEEEKQSLKQKYEIKDDEIVIGYLARIEELKGHKYLIEAANIIKNEKTKRKFKILLMGSGSYEEKAKELVKELALEDMVIFTGFINDVEKMLNIVDVQINASYLSETTCLSLLEGMSLGVPTVATKCGGTPKMIEEWENGLLVEKADSKALAEGILKIIENKEKYEHMKEVSKRIFKERYTSKVYASNIEKIYESMVK
ncbi:MAG: glycosyltransferase [Clostridia bacterium]|nr:glycosyltransferase [Clostridia bacterium]